MTCAAKPAAIAAQAQEPDMEKIRFKNRNGADITMAAIIHFPTGFDSSRQYPAVVVAHPGGGVKEQTAGLYASKLAEQGFVSIAFDASYQGESTGEPRQLEDPHVRTQDISAVIDHLTTLPYVDRERVGAMGICAGAGYTANAAINDRRIKAVGTVSAVNIGSMFRNGWDNNVKSADAIPLLEHGSQARTTEAGGAGTVTIPLAPLRKEDAPNQELEEAWEYYHTPRARHPTAPGFATARSLNQIITYAAYSMADVFLTQPLQIVAGSESGSKWMSDDLFHRAASQDKHFHVVEGASHMSLYDVPQYVDEALSKLAPFFRSHL
ncbi:alpha/beta hydrolase [Cupriavidus sp. TA19]|uniref:alpha/beta hydrolase n=2 Tax=unclassified Cupriavidus TaxID=2640874 RepID=UPI00295EA170|nr:alpha/beta hydrolase [Cupriavidus sp. TA19]